MFVFWKKSRLEKSFRNCLTFRGTQWQNVSWDFTWKYTKDSTIYLTHKPKLANYLGYFSKTPHQMHIVHGNRVNWSPKKMVGTGPHIPILSDVPAKRDAATFSHHLKIKAIMLWRTKKDPCYVVHSTYYVCTTFCLSQQTKIRAQYFPMSNKFNNQWIRSTEIRLSD